MFAQLCPAVGLSLGLAAAQSPLSVEAQAIMQGAPQGPMQAANAAPITALLSQEWPADSCSHSVAGRDGQGLGCVDVLVATPGRLIAHLEHTPGFTLDHLCFLVSLLCW